LIRPHPISPSQPPAIRPSVCRPFKARKWCCISTRSTPGCTTESQQFRDLNPEFLSAGTVVLGISRDSVRSHENFRIKQSLPFDLVSDPEETACTLFGVMKMKNMYGKQVRGIERSTFVIDAAGILRREWRGVKVPGHAQEVLDYIKTL